MRLQLFIFLSLLCEFLYGQVDSTAYDRSFVFKEGIYLTKEDFKRNQPIALQSIVSNEPKYKLNFLSKEVARKQLLYMNDSGVKVSVDPSTLWGYCQNQTVYINYKGDFYRVPVLGSVFHFIAYEEVVVGYVNPSFYDYGAGFPNTRLEQVQILYDAETNSFSSFNSTNLELILSRDEQLLASFRSLPKRKQRKSTFIYLRKYNEKHPLYFYN